MSTIVHKNEKGELCITMTEAQYRNQLTIERNCIFDTTPFTGQKFVRGYYPSKMTLDEFYANQSQDLSSKVTIPTTVRCMSATTALLPETFYICQIEEELIVTMFGDYWKIEFSTNIPKDAQLENPEDVKQQALAMEFSISQLTSQGIKMRNELQSYLSSILEIIGTRLANQKRA